MTELTINQALQKAIEARKSGQVQEADRLYTAILKAQPKHPDANHSMGVLAVGVGKAEQALPFFKTALEANPAIAQFWLSYIDALIKLDKLADAKAVLDQAKSKGAKGDGFDKLEQRLKDAEQEPLESNQIASEPQPKQPNILDSLKLDQAISLAKKKARDGSAEEAKRIYQDILTKFPKNKRAIDGLKGLVGMRVGKASKAQDPPQDQVQSLMILYNKGQLALVVEHAQGLTKQYPEAFAVWNLMGASAAQIGQLDQAIFAFKRVLGIKPDNAEAYSNLGNALKKQGKLEEAVEAYNQALALNPSNAKVYYNMGNALKEQDKLEEAVEAYNKTLAIEPSNAEAYYNMGNALKEQDKLGAAIEAYNNALLIKPDNAEAYYNMGLTLKEQGKLEEAIEACNKALAIKPNYAEAYNNMGLTLTEQGKLDEAIEAYNKALAIEPDNATSYNNMGLTLKEQGKLDEAIKTYSKALAIKPNNTSATENSLSLQVQLQGTVLTTSTFSNQATKSSTPDTNQSPISHIYNAISSFLSADWGKAHRHIQDFNTCDPKLIANLAPKNKLFCSAYSEYLSALLKEPFEQSPHIHDDNVIYHLGESHCLSYAHHKIGMNGTTFRVAPLITFGAKAFHFSKTKDDAYKAITKANFTSIPQGSKVFISFGEIDCRPNEGFISAATKLNKSIEEIITSTVIGYLRWFSEQNNTQNHSVYMLNVPAPMYDIRYNAKTNAAVANVVALFNTQIKKQIAQFGFNIIDVYRFTFDQDGFSNGRFYIDEKHLGAKAIPEIEQQLNS